MRLKAVKCLDATAVPKLAEQALLLQFACSLTDIENLNIHHDVVKANPGLSEKELSAVKRAVMIAKAQAWKGRLDEQHKSKEASNSVPPVKDSPLPFLNLGTIKPVDDRTLVALQEGQSQDAKPYSCLTLTTEERMAVFATTKAANPDANRVDFGLAYKIALRKADSQKRGINPCLEK